MVADFLQAVCNKKNSVRKKNSVPSQWLKEDTEFVSQQEEFL
jgi:hypothetical protein